MTYFPMLFQENPSRNIFFLCICKKRCLSERVSEREIFIIVVANFLELREENCVRSLSLSSHFHRPLTTSHFYEFSTEHIKKEEEEGLEMECKAWDLK